MKTKEVIKEYKLKNDRILTLVGVAQDVLIDVGVKDDKTIFEQKGCTLSVGWAVKNPTDDMSPSDLGTTIARGRASKKPIAHVWIDNPRMSDNLILTILDATAKEVEERFYSFIPLSSGKTKKQEAKEPDKKKEVVHKK